MLRTRSGVEVTVHRNRDTFGLVLSVPCPRRSVRFIYACWARSLIICDAYTRPGNIYSKYTTYIHAYIQTVLIHTYLDPYIRRKAHAYVSLTVDPGPLIHTRTRKLVRVPCDYFAYARVQCISQNYGGDLM